MSLFTVIYYEILKILFYICFCSCLLSFLNPQQYSPFRIQFFFRGVKVTLSLLSRYFLYYDLPAFSRETLWSQGCHSTHLLISSRFVSSRSLLFLPVIINVKILTELKTRSP